MNLGKYGVLAERESVGSSSARYGNKAGISLLRMVFFAVVACVVAGICLLLGAYKGCVDGTPDLSTVNIMPMGYATFVYDTSGNQIQKLNSAAGNRVSVSINEIPADMQHAIVAIEDSRFYQHNGVDPYGMIRALTTAVRTGFRRTEGASTITQQLLKNNVFSGWVTETRLKRIERKIQEQHLAVQLEKSLAASGQNPKSVILENYLNTVNFGSGAYGVQTAAQTYFRKDAKDLTLSECAVLAAIPQNPSLWNPRRHPDKNAERRATVLEYMQNQGYITLDQKNTALADDVYTRIQAASGTGARSEVYTYFVDELINQVKEDLMEQKGWTEMQATTAIYSGGLKIYSTQNSQIQSILDEEFANMNNFPEGIEIGLDWALTVDKANGMRENYSREMLQKYFRENEDSTFDLVFSTEGEAQGYVDRYKKAVVKAGDKIVAERISFIPQPQASMTIIDQSTGYVKGIVGGRGGKQASLTLNRATNAWRQPGATFQAIASYGPALDMGRITLATHIVDEAFKYESGREVNNSDGKHKGNMTVRAAITNTNNVVAVKVMTAITPMAGFEYLQRLGFTRLVNDDKKDVTQALALGGITNGVNNLELTAAFAAVANGGTYIKPVFYTKVTDHDGNVILENSPMATEIFKESTAWLLTDAMQDCVESGSASAFRLSGGMPVAGIAGTTNANRDLTFAGFTPYYTAAIWAGYDTSAELPVTYRDYYHVLWTNVMNRIHASLPVKTFTMPNSVQQVTLCAVSGLLAGRGCRTLTEYFDVSTVPNQTCMDHIPKPKVYYYVTPTPAPNAAAG